MLLHIKGIIWHLITFKPYLMSLTNAATYGVWSLEFGVFIDTVFASPIVSTRAFAFQLDFEPLGFNRATRHRDPLGLFASSELWWSIQWRGCNCLVSISQGCGTLPVISVRKACPQGDRPHAISLRPAAQGDLCTELGGMLPPRESEPQYRTTVVDALRVPQSPGSMEGSYYNGPGH